MGQKAHFPSIRAQSRSVNSCKETVDRVIFEESFLVGLLARRNDKNVYYFQPGRPFQNVKAEAVTEYLYGATLNIRHPPGSLPGDPCTDVDVSRRCERPL